MIQKRTITVVCDECYTDLLKDSEFCANLELEPLVPTIDPESGWYISDSLHLCPECAAEMEP